MAVVFEGRCLWPVHFEQDLRLGLQGQVTESTLHERVEQDKAKCWGHRKMGWVDERSSPAV